MDAITARLLRAFPPTNQVDFLDEEEEKIPVVFVHTTRHSELRKIITDPESFREKKCSDRVWEAIFHTVPAFSPLPAMIMKRNGRRLGMWGKGEPFLCFYASGR